jgi:alkanesulfonate monooxygenase SsuD/methylene tetrahydromethanopterin reductase-like flavin-dependent oxidoreductase (luciferase family)
LIRDHFIEEPFGHQLAPLTALAAVAGATNRLRVGSLVLSNDYRHPMMLAKEIATLDVLSGGRVELGLGAGFSKAEYESYAFLRLALRHGSVEGPYRGPARFSEDPFTYTNASTGELDAFWGLEQITRSGEKVSELRDAGGFLG